VAYSEFGSVNPSAKVGPKVIPLPEERRYKAYDILFPFLSSLRECRPPKKPAADIIAAAEEKTEETEVNASEEYRPMLLQNQIPGIAEIENENERYKYDVNSRPDVVCVSCVYLGSTDPLKPDLEAYDRMPVDEIGGALLRGMGWEEGKPIGLNSKTYYQLLVCVFSFSAVWLSQSSTSVVIIVWGWVLFQRPPSRRRRNTSSRVRVVRPSPILSFRLVLMARCAT